MPAPSLASMLSSATLGGPVHAFGSSSNLASTAGEPFAQTLLQSMQAQPAASTQASGNTQSDQPGTVGGDGTNTATAATNSNASGDSTTQATSSAKRSNSSSHAQADDNHDTTQSAAGLAAAAAVQAQLQLRAGGTATSADASGDTSSGASQDAQITSATTLGATQTDDDPLADAQSNDTALTSTTTHLLSDQMAHARIGARAPGGHSEGAQQDGDNAGSAQDGSAARSRTALDTFDAQFASASTGGDASAAGTALSSTGTGAASSTSTTTDSATTNTTAAPGADLAALPITLQAGTSGISGANAKDGTDSLSPTVGTNAWEEALNQKVVFLAQAGQSSAELTLNPPGLGPLQISLHLANDNAHALFVAQHAEVRDAVQAALPQLRTAFEASGLSLGSASVSDQSFSSSQQNQQPGYDGRAQNNSGIQSTTANAEASAVADLAGAASTVSQSTLVRAGLVNTFA